MEIVPRDLCFYGFVPTDLPSLRMPNGDSSKGGKISAHALHAGHQILKYADHKDVKEYIQNGINQGADYFNTVITKDAKCSQIDNLVKIAKSLGYVANVVIDPEYPFFIEEEFAGYLDKETCKGTPVKSKGKVLMLRKQLTFGWILGDKNDPIFMSLHQNFNLAE